MISSTTDEDVVMAIPSIEGSELLARMLPTLRFRPASVVVLDQGSSDRTGDICREAGVELMQLGRPHTYTQACNIGAEIARRRGCRYVCVSNNDITFQTDVLHELAAEMDRDDRLAIVAPSQAIIDEKTGRMAVARRVRWDLERVEFFHDLEPGGSLPRRLEADFCELTCALIRMSALDEIGFLDDAYGFYHEDADFCFRLRSAGYSCAYLPRSQINHYSSSTFSKKRQEQIDYLAKNKIYFARKHLGLGLRHDEDEDARPSDSSSLDYSLNPVLRRFGLLDPDRPELTVGAVGAVGAATSPYVLDPRSLETVPERWKAFSGRHRAVMVPTARMAAALQQSGLPGFHVPLGIDPDIFTSWGAVQRPFDETTFLAVLAPTQTAVLTVLRAAWHRTALPRARLVIVGSHLAKRMTERPDSSYRVYRTTVLRYPQERIEIHDLEQPMADQELAQLFRSVDFSIAPTAYAATLRLFESTACGTPCIISASGPVSGPEIVRNGHGPGQWTVDALAEGIRRAASLSAADRAAISTAGERSVAGHATLRHTVEAVRSVLEKVQQRDPEPVVGRIEQARLEIALAERTEASFRGKISRAAAHGVTRGATLVSGFGMIWHDRGLRAAMAAATVRGRAIVDRRMGPAPRPEGVDPEPIRRAASSVEAASDRSALLIGSVDAQSRFSPSLRGLARAMESAGLPFGIYPVGSSVGSRWPNSQPVNRSDQAALPVNVIDVPPPELPRVMHLLGRELVDGSYNVLRTSLRPASVTAGLRSYLDGMDEIWAPTSNCGDALRSVFDGPITIVPPCVEPARPSGDVRSRFGLNPDDFYFMLSLPDCSGLDPGDQTAAIRAFLQAFPDISRPVGLVVEGMRLIGDEAPRELRVLAQSDDRIRIVDEPAASEDAPPLIASVDCYVSPCTSGGLGIRVAKAMIFGKPVIAGDLRGNIGLLGEDADLLAESAGTEARSEEAWSAAGPVWTELDEDACIAAMRHVVENPVEATRKAEVGRRLAERRFSPENVGRIVAGRLEQIRATGRRRPLEKS